MFKYIRQLIKSALCLFWLLLQTLVQFVKVRFMTLCFPKKSHSDNIYLSGNYAPVHDELTVEHLHVTQGKVPDDLPDGYFARVGPNPQFTPKGTYHWFDGDGMIHMIEFNRRGTTRRNNNNNNNNAIMSDSSSDDDDEEQTKTSSSSGSGVHYRNRYIRTEKYTKENKHGGAISWGLLFCGSFWCYLDNLWSKYVLGIDVPSDLGTANISMLNLPNVGLLALHECASPVQLDLHTLKTLNPKFDWNGKLKGAFTAHPKVDPKTGETFFFAYNMLEKPHATYGIIDTKGQLKTFQPLEMLHETYIMHDFSLTENYVIFMCFPFTFKLARMVDGNDPIQFESKVKTKFVILPKYYSPRTHTMADVRIIEAESCYLYHIANAYEEGEHIYIRGSRMEVGDFNVFTVGQENFRKEVEAHFYEWKLNLRTLKTDNENYYEAHLVDNSGMVHLDKKLFDYGVEFPIINKKYVGIKNRYVYLGTFYDYEGSTGVTKMDLQTRTFQNYKYPDDCFSGEVQFVPKKGAVDEDDGYLMTYIYNQRTNQSSLIIIDAKTMKPEPAALISIPRRIPFGFHTIFVPTE